MHGIDYEETFSPTANITSIRILMQFAAQYDLTVHQMDVKTAFLHAPIDHAVDHCVYQKQTGEDVIIVVVWVDDLIIASNNTDKISQFKENMKSKFRMKDLGEISYFLGISFKQGSGVIKMNQKRYVQKILDRFGMSDCKPRTTPCEQRFEGMSDSEQVDPRRYREIVGSLIYLMTCTRPDISWVVNKLSQKLSCPRIEDLVTAKHVLRYLKGSMEYELCFRKCDGELNLIAYTDADRASSLDDRHSTTGYCFSLTENGPPILWKSKKQPTIALSTCEAAVVCKFSSRYSGKFIFDAVT